MPLATCPSLVELEHLLLGELPEQDVERLERHVQGCDACREQLVQLRTKETVAAARRDNAAWMTKLDTMCAASVSDAATNPNLGTDLSSQDASRNAPTLPPPSMPDPTESSLPLDADSKALTDFLVPPQAPDELGRLGKYRILKILGAGGMGVVYKAEDSQLQRTVAIKVMLPGLATSASAGKRFLREAQAMAKVEHDHIVRIYQVDEDRGVPFMAMEFLKGEPLNERLKRETQLPLGDVLRMGREIADGLGAAHATGLIHRDIKPGNIWLETPRNRVKILDFGLARAASQDVGLTQQGAIVGTPAYMAPEQGRGDTVDARCDLFSLGVVLYRLCTGRQPFGGSNTIALLMAVATEEPPAPSALSPDVPQELSDLVMKLLEKEPDRRPGSGAEVVQALQAIERRLARKKVSEEDTVSLSATAKQSNQAARPRRWLVPVVAVAVLLGGLIGVIAVTAAVIHFKNKKDDVANARPPEIPPLPIQNNDGDPWFNRVAGLPTEQQVEEVVGELKKLNPDFDGKEAHKIDDGQVTSLELLTDDVHDISPVRALTALRSLTCGGTAGKGQLKDLSPLKNLKLTDLIFPDTQVDDLSPLKDMPLTYLRFEHTPVSDLAPLARMKLTSLQCDATKISDLAPLKDMPLTYLRCGSTEVADLSPLKGSLLRTLNLSDSRVSDLSPLADLPLTILYVKGTPVTNLSPIQGRPLTDIQCDFRPYRDTEVLRSIKTLMTINGKPAAQFWKDEDAHQAAFEAWRRRVVNLPGGTGLGDVLTKLKEYNPGFDGKHSVQNKGGGILSLTIATDKVTELSPVRALPRLEVLNCAGSAPDKGQVADLSPLKDLKLTALNCSNTKVTNLLPIRGLKLTTLNIDNTKVTDLSPLKNMKLESLTLAGTPVADLAPLKDVPLKHLSIAGTNVTDLAPLKDMRLTSFSCSGTQVWDLSPLWDMRLTVLNCDGSKVTDFSVLHGMPLTAITGDFKPLRDADSLRSIKTLETINGKPAKEFWKDVDAKQQAFEMWCKQVAALPPGKQAEAVADKLKEHNPGFDGIVKHKVESGAVTELRFLTDDVTDISPVRALPGLRTLDCATAGKGRLVNLSPLTDLKLTTLNITGTRVSDLSLLRRMPLKELRCDSLALKDVESLRALKTTLETINDKPAKEFWKDVDNKKP